MRASRRFGNQEMEGAQCVLPRWTVVEVDSAHEKTCVGRDHAHVPSIPIFPQFPFHFPFSFPFDSPLWGDNIP